VSKKKNNGKVRYEVTVWNMVNGDIVRKLWDADADDVSEIREQYGDNPLMQIIVEKIL